jgi:hypothetical protein
MELIPHDQFGRLRLIDFMPDAAEVVELEDWEYLDRLWLGEATGFTDGCDLLKTPRY